MVSLKFAEMAKEESCRSEKLVATHDVFGFEKKKHADSNVFGWQL